MRHVLMGLGVAVLLIGLVWFGQGMGWLQGSSMTGDRFWAIVGPLTAAVGVGMVSTAVRMRRR
jgi:hypothetical protein